jgi:hypothetical protein
MLLDLIRRQAVRTTTVSPRLSRFHSKSVPPISIFEYLESLWKCIRLSSPALLTLLLYMRRLSHIPSPVSLSYLTIHRLLLSCAAISTKILTDQFCSNKSHARAGGIRPEELTVLEVELLQALSWDVVPRNEDLAECYLDLVDRNGGYILFMSRSRV